MVREGKKMAPLSTRQELFTRPAHTTKGKAARTTRKSSGARVGAMRSKSFAKGFQLLPVTGKPMVFERRPDLKDNQRYIDFSRSAAGRNFWFNLVIGCSGPDPVSRNTRPARAFRSRNAAKIEYALADAGRLHDFVNGLPILFWEQVFPLGERPVAGTFAETACLREPTSADLDSAFGSIRAFFEKNEGDPEWDGGQADHVLEGRARKELATTVERRRSG